MVVCLLMINIVLDSSKKQTWQAAHVLCEHVYSSSLKMRHTGLCICFCVRVISSLNFLKKQSKTIKWLHAYFPLIPLPPTFLSWVSHPANKEWHVGLVTPKQHDKRPQGREGREGAGECKGGDRSGLNSLCGKREESLVPDIVQNQHVFRVEAAQVSTLEEW